jgi:hypothetical protein
MKYSSQDFRILQPAFQLSAAIIARIATASVDNFTFATDRASFAHLVAVSYVG